MRLDKFLKVSRIIKRRTVANDVCTLGRVSVNGKPLDYLVDDIKDSYNLSQIEDNKYKMEVVKKEELKEKE